MPLWRPQACRVDTRVDACPVFFISPEDKRRDESRRGTHECVRHITVLLVGWIRLFLAESQFGDRGFGAVDVYGAGAG